MRTKSKTFISKGIILLFVAIIISSFNYIKPKTETVEGYRLIEKRFVKEVNAEVYFFEHIKSGAHIIKIAAPDPNKTFGIAFRTEPNSNGGTPHIIEHSVLNGSKNYPVKSPFDELSKTSLKTFLNAMTSSDFTIYPAASMNKKDYFNLMGVYFDAVYFPLIYNDPRIFKQEGWHYELTSKEDPITYKGVVYNEMKGAFSSPQRELSYQIYKNLFPDNGYGLSSGGYPQDIPKLTYQGFLDFHKKNYHPANSYIVLYGDADMTEEMKMIDEKYLSKFEKIEVNSDIKIQKPYDALKEVTANYSVIEGTPTDNKTYLSLSWVIGKKTDLKLVMALDILSDVLVMQESAPIRLALQKAGIGQDVSAYSNDIQQNVFTITVKNANLADKDKFKEIVFNVLKEQSEKGIDKDAVAGYLNRREFYLREGDDAQKGLSYMMQAVSNWMFTGEPFSGLEWEKPLAEIKTAIDNKYLEQEIVSGFLNNNFALLMVLEPKPGLEKEINEKTAIELANYKASLSEEELDKLISETNELIAYQQSEDDENLLKVVPKLERADLNPKSEWFSYTEKKIGDSKIIHYNDFTNNVVYANAMFDMSVLPTELLPYAALLTEIYGSMDTKNYSFGDLEKQLSLNTGTFYTYINDWSENYDDNKLITKFVVTSKAMNVKTEKMFQLMNEIILNTKFDDTERLKSILLRHQSQLESRVQNDGMGFAITRANSYYSNSGMFQEITKGFEYYWFINKLIEDFDTNSADVITKLKQTATLLFNKNNMIVGTTCSEKDYPVFKKGFSTFVKQIPSSAVTNVKRDYKFENKDEAFVSSSKVQYVIKAYDFKKLGYNWDGKYMVLSKILSSDYLQTKIRVIGGAYGGFSNISRDGKMYFGSYRDPNLKETLENYDATPEYLKSFEASEDKMLGYIIGTISTLDRPLTPSQKGNLAYDRYFRKYTSQDLQADREAILSTSAEDIKGMYKMVEDILKQNVYCVYGNKEKIELNKDLFKSIKTLNNK